jgi:hypothetical protein
MAMFSERIQRLLDALGPAAAPAPVDLAAAIDALPAVGELPSPWEGWPLLGLVRHHARQQWVLAVVRERLLADPQALARAGALAHPQALPQAGPVPGLPGWRYFFHGSGCCLQREDTGEAIDVDFDDDTADHFDTYFYAGYLRTARAPDVPEDRSRTLHPDDATLALAIEDLQATGALLRGSHRVYFRVAPALLAAADAVEAATRAAADPARRTWVCACLGDWVEAHACAADPALRERLAPRAAACRALRRARLTAALAAGDEVAGLHGLVDLDGDAACERLLVALAGPPDGAVSVALDLLEARWHDRFADPVLAVLRRVDPRGAAPEPWLFAAAAAALLTRGRHVDEVLTRVAEIGAQAGGRLLLLALAHRAPAALALVRAGLRAPAPFDRISTAGLLAAIDLPWTRRELRAVLAGSDDLEATSECRAALRRSADPRDHAAVAAWERLHPYAAPGAPPYTGLDVHLANVEADVDEAADELAALVETHRARLVDPDRAPAS